MLCCHLEFLSGEIIDFGFSLKTALAALGLHWPTVDEGLDTAALTSVSLMLLGRWNATTGGSGNNLASVSLFFQFLSNDDGQCLKFSLKRDGK
jgi:hypothetical protein